MAAPVRLLVITGTVGSGKTTVGLAASDVLAQREVPHALLDRDMLCTSWPQVGRFNDDMAFRNIEAVWPNFRDAGATHLIVVGVLEDRAHLDRYRDAIPGADPTVVRITATLEERRRRIHAREEGWSLDWHLNRTEELDAILDRADLADHTVANDTRPIAATAERMLHLIGWL